MHGDAAYSEHNNALALKDRGNVLRVQNRLHEALQSYDAALALDPNYVAALYNRGTVLLELARPEDALASFDGVLQVARDDAGALVGRGNALLDLGRNADALASYERALEIAPDDIGALVNRANVLLDLDRKADAIVAYRRVVAHALSDATVLHNCGNALLALKQSADALACYGRALAIDPDRVQALTNSGDILLELKRPHEALQSYERALALTPNDPDAYVRRGNALLALDRPAEALAAYDHALALRSDDALTFHNRGNALVKLGRHQDALNSYRRATTLQVDRAHYHYSESLCRLVMGDFENGWREYVWRWEVEELDNPKRRFSQLQWRGESPIAAKTVLLYAEQGLGDTVQFCRYAKLVAAQGATVLLEVQPELRWLLANLDGVTRLLPKGEPLPAFDCHCALLDLPLAFKTQLHKIPADIPYIRSDPARVERWVQRLGTSSQPRIGIVWTGGTLHKHDSSRSMTFAEFARLMVPGAAFVSLQKEIRAVDLTAVNECKDIRRFEAELHDFADTASLIDLLDLVIAVDTSVAHVAAAMGKPVWILLPFACDWRWMTDRDDSPWYPTVRLFRQSVLGDWAGVIDRVSAALQEHLRSLAADGANECAAEDPVALKNRGNALRERKRLDEALASYEAALAIDPNYVAALYNRALVLLELGRAEGAVQSFDRVLRLAPEDAEALVGRGNALVDLNRPTEALASYDRALDVVPNDASALYNRANVLLASKRADEALRSYDCALQIAPQHLASLIGRGDALLALKRPRDALESYQRAVALEASNVDVLNRCGNALMELKRPAEALAWYERALAIEPDNVPALNNRGTAWLSLQRPDDALASYRRVLDINPSFAGALNNSATALLELKQDSEAAAMLRLLVAIAPDFPYALGRLIDCELRICEWTNLHELTSRIDPLVQAGERAVVPFTYVAMSHSPLAQLNCTGIYAKNEYPASLQPLWVGGRYGHKRIRLAYLSPDLRDHPVTHLTIGLFEAHDKERFETIGIYFGPPVHDEMRARIERAFDRFVDVGDRSDREVGELMRAMEIDIAVDLSGYTTHCRPGIVAQRAAPVQVNYLGYPGTLGAPYVDYIIADRTVIPEADARHYAERVVYLPDTFQPNDARRRIAERTPLRSEVGLPEQGMVFCSFNNTYKITPLMFDVWMRLVRRVKGSVLWLQEGNAVAVGNLRREAEKRGVAAQRLVFAGKTPRVEDHIARYRLAHLFLDTLPYNAHTTASDALWAGLPVLTCLGATYAGRVAASVLQAVGLPELVTRNLEEYEALAFELATDGSRLGELRERLSRNRTTHALFDTERFRRHIEAAYVTMWERSERGDTPEGFSVPQVVHDRRSIDADALKLKERGNELMHVGRAAEALSTYERALQLKPDYVDAIYNSGNAWMQLKRYPEALATYDRALVFAADDAMVWNNRGLCLQALNRHEDALASFERALAVKRGYLDALNNRGNVLQELKRYGEAAESFAELAECAPDYAEAAGRLLECQLRICEWKDVDRLTSHIASAVDRGEQVVTPFFFLAISDSPRAQLRCAQTHVAREYPASLQPLWVGGRYGHKRIRLAYLSPDLRDHPVTHLTIGLFEAHDKERFETIGIYFGPPVHDEMRARIERAFDRFVDVGDRSDREVGELMRAMEIDIAVDLSGYTTHCRPGIVAQRAAPVQVNYLGYPGTLGAPYVDYIIADRTVIPEADARHYAERVVYLPDTFQPNDARRRIAERTPLRSEVGLPEQGMVFCSFNNTYKITPLMFDVWMRLVRRVKGSVLWLQEGNAVAVGNLRREAEKRGVAAQRLVFAGKTPRVEDHIARYRLAHLFLDTLPYNAHTTASDALWAGLPVLTCLGATYAGRVAASVLQAVGLPELVTRNLEEYEALAFELATDGSRLGELRERLSRNRTTHALFDTERFRRHIEAAYVTMWERCQTGDTPTSFTVSPCMPGNTAVRSYDGERVRDDVPCLQQSDIGDWRGLARELANGLKERFSRRRERSKLVTPHVDAVPLQVPRPPSPERNGLAVPTVSDILQQALALHQAAQLSEAEALYRQVLVVTPENFDALHFLGVIQLQRGHCDTAVELISKAIEVRPEAAAPHSNLGLAYQALRDPARALANYDCAISLEPRYVEALFNRGNVLLELSRYQDAVGDYDRVLSLDPHHFGALYNRGNALMELKAQQAALASYDRALSIRPDDVEALYNRGHALRKLERNADAVISFDRVIEQQCNHADALYTRGNALQELGRLDEALASYAQALAIKPHFPSAHYNEGLCRLLMGDFETGWRKYEWRWKDETLANPPRDFVQPLWLGGLSVSGKTVLLHAEQGMGDTLQFCRYAELVAERGAAVLLEVQPALKPLLGNVKGVTQLLLQGEHLPAFDYHCPLLSLPLAFDTRLDTIPAKVPYLSAEATRLEKWKGLLGTKKLPRIGLVWSGRAAHKNDHHRSASLAQFVRLLSPQAQFVSLQKELRPGDRTILTEYPEFLHFGDDLQDFADTAALTELMDLVITVDTSVAHLAGAMGKPVWILLPEFPDWRWMLNRGDCPWYPSARLFRQRVAGNWKEVIDRVFMAMQRTLPSRGSDS